ncbi:MAG: LysM peptidoglycan-binding domain-containing protein [Anaerolineae bacterium]|nr:LysM peptidoglycan-binding domain-containing protein [Anaerolineae bacterium]
MLWEIQATQTVQAQPTMTPYLGRRQPDAPQQSSQEASPTLRPILPKIGANRYQVNTIRHPDGSPASLILRSLDPLSLSELISESSLTPILGYYHPAMDNLSRLISSCNGLRSDELEAGQVILIPLAGVGTDTCSPDPALAHRYLPIDPQEFQVRAARISERVLIYFTEANETLNTLASKFESSVERLRELNAGLDAAPPDLPLRPDTLVYVRVQTQYQYVSPVLAAPPPSKSAILVFTQSASQASLPPPQPTPLPQPTLLPQPTPTIDPGQPALPTATPEPAPTFVAVEPFEPQPAVVAAVPTLPPDERADAGTSYDPRQIFDPYVKFLAGEPFSSTAIITTPPIIDGQPITVDGNAALKYLTKKNAFIGGAVNIAVRAAIRGSTLEFPAVGFYGILAGAQLDRQMIDQLAKDNNLEVLEQQALREGGDPLAKTMMLAYDQLLRDRPNLQFLVLISHNSDGKIRGIAYLYEASSQQEWTTLSGAPLNLDGCPPGVQLVMMAATYDWERQTVEFH